MKKIIFVILLLLTFNSCTNRDITVNASHGFADLSNKEFTESNLISLNGEWEFYWEQLLNPDNYKDYTPKDYITVPGYWNKRKSPSENYPRYGYATFILKLKLPEQNKVYGLRLQRMVSSFKLYVDGDLAVTNGIVSKNRETYSPHFRNETYYFTPNSKEIAIICQIANFDYRKGGMWVPFQIGSQQAVSKKFSSGIAIDLFLCGSLLIMALYHIALYIYRKNDKTALYFGLFCLTIVARLTATGETIATYFFHNFSWEILIKMELMPFYLGGIFFLLFFSHLLKNSVNKTLLKIFISLSSIFAVLVIILPVRYANFLVEPMEILILIGMSAIIYWIIKASIKKIEGWQYLIIGFIVFFFSGINDILYSQQIINSIYMIPFGLFVFIFSQSILLAKMFSNSFTKIEVLSNEMTSLNHSMKRFVPDEFLTFLNKNSIQEIKLGDQILKEMTILFSDIESFTTLSEKMDPQENFNFLNSYLNCMGPAIRKRNGFIDKYIGDAIMALFPNNASEAVNAAIDMHKELKNYNQDRHKLGQEPIKFGTGIHTGKMMLGIIGEDERLESTVISDAVNLASRIERLTRVYGLDILISGSSLVRLENVNSFNFRMIDISKIKGKVQKISIFEIYDHQDPSIIDLKNKTKSDLEKAINSYHEGNLDECSNSAQKVLQMNPNDKVAALYFERSKFSK